MKMIFRLFVVAVLALLAWSAWTYPKIGAVMYQDGGALEAKLYGFEKQSIDIGEMELAAYVGGPVNAPAIVMVHGYSAEKNVWPRFARHFVQDYRVIIPDMAGHGETGFDQGWQYDIASQARRVRDLLDALKIKETHVIGNSMGGFITAQFGLDFPERALSLGLVDPAGVASPQPSDMEIKLAQGENPFLIESREDFAEFYPMSMAQPPYLPGFILDAVADNYIERRDELAHIFKHFKTTPLLTPRLPTMQDPVLLLWGAKDRLIHVSATEVWSAGLPNVDVEIYPELGHMPMVEAPQRSAERYKAFLQGL